MSDCIRWSTRATGHARGARRGHARRTRDFLEILATSVETHDRSLSAHGRRVSVYANRLAERLGVSTRDRALVRIGAFLHDLGKIGVPKDLLRREGALDAGERRIMEQHPLIGARLVRPLGLHRDLVAAIRHHHEWWDGSGYPDKLARRGIPYAARIVSIADAFDAMTSDRPYRAALPRETVLGELRRGAGVQFDPELVPEFLALLESDRAGGGHLHAAEPSTRIAAAGLASASL